MEVIDIHHHAVPDRFLDTVRRRGGAYGIELRRRADGAQWLEGHGAEFRVRATMCDLDVRLEQARRTQIDIAMTSLLPTILFYGTDERTASWIAGAVNDSLIADADESGGRCRPVAYVPLQHPELAARTLSRLVDDHDVRAVAIGSNVTGRNLDDPALDPFWAAAEGIGALVFVHPHDRVADARLRPYHLANLIGNPLDTTIAIAGIIFGGVLERFPDLKLCFAHTGGYVPWIHGRWRHGHEVREETRVNGVTKDIGHYLQKLYFDTVIHDTAALRYATEVLGAGNLLYGTDCPADMADLDQVVAISAIDGLTDSERVGILGRNAARLLGFDEDGKSPKES